MVLLDCCAPDVPPACPNCKSTADDAPGSTRATWTTNGPSGERIARLAASSGVVRRLCERLMGAVRHDGWAVPPDPACKCAVIADAIMEEIQGRRRSR